ncbi:hypothetical protein AAG906_003699 [Vitis piasezkii]
MLFDQHSDAMVLDMMRGMYFMSSLGLGQRQHGPMEFVAINHDKPFRLGEWMSLSISFTIYNETIDCGVNVEPTGVIDRVVPCDEYRDEMDMMSMILSPRLMEDVATGDDLFEDTFGSIMFRSNLYGSSDKRDCCRFFQRCPEFTHFDLTMTFRWGIDIIGKISPKSSKLFHQVGGNASYVKLTSSRVVSFIISHIICCYGVPNELISNRGVHFRAKVDTLLQKYGIRHHRFFAYRPQTNGAVEVANKNIKKMVETSRDWSKKLHFALWAYRTCFRTSTRATPYSLVYGVKAILPIDTRWVH